MLTVMSLLFLIIMKGLLLKFIDFDNNHLHLLCYSYFMGNRFLTSSQSLV